MRDRCAECGALPPEGRTCQDIFNEFTTFKYLDESYFQVHLPMVTCFMIQHGRYSDPGLTHARSLLCAYVEQQMTVPQLYQLAAQGMSSRERTWKMNRLENDAPPPSINWRMTLIDVAQGSHMGEDTSSYCELVRQWARSILEQMAI
ncbi:DUF5946 family protein [Ktedonospora formicarum]|uniref:Uncharacterized protein n=1 Tax=Ktedonospora formicarum TaxID=2778364 RepID=A0A8J3IC02_9CHLR|nr:DUF5946 family protein [Ktedonospora formicarum]GHO49503.1 hypothetical protein KSX_76660 [Ktedonospora formicarum]